MILKSKQTSLLMYLFIMTGFFFLLEFSFFIQCNRTYLGDYTFVADKIQVPTTILPGVFYFALAQLSIHVVFTLLIWLVFLMITALLNIPEQKKFSWAMVIWGLGVLYALIANQYYLPNSKFAELTGLVLRNHFITNLAFMLLSVVWYLLLALALVGLCKLMLLRAQRGHSGCPNVRNKSMVHLSLTLFAVLGLVIFFILPERQKAKPFISSQSKPNIILIGIDSLRPDYLSFFGHNPSTPFMDSFLANATVFAEAITPLARTFPSWTGIFTGQYPRENNIRFNLAQQVNVNLEYSLGNIFKRQGYETIFATDETRFSNIDKNYGFDHVISPPMGLNDFLIGTFNDFPLSNLVINTPVGKLLFPYSYANRPVFFAYDPNSFIQQLKSVLNKPRTKPLFLTVHFCLPHYPYLWASLPGNDFNPWERYSASIVRVDQQVKDFYAELKAQHFLDHAIVVLLSDHGEALELPGDRATEASAFIASTHKQPPHFYPPSLDEETVDQSGGHGTDVLGLTQYHSLLAFQLLGLGKQNPQVVSGIVSLLDIKPTLLTLMKIRAPKTSGVSLAPVINGAKSIANTQRHFFLESDFSPAAIRTVYPQAEKVLLDGIELFQIDAKTTRLTVKPAMGHMILHSKQYADIYQNWMLALYPQTSQQRMPILINLMTGQWTNDLKSPFAQHSPASVMQQKLQLFYGKDLS